MKRVALLLLPIAAACASLSGGGLDVGASSPATAIQQFLGAAKRQDLTAMSNVWGTASGPARKSIPQKELERREFIMMKCLAHEKASLGTASPGEGGRLRVPVELTMVTKTAKPVFTVVRGPHDRWFVENLELDQLRDQGFCSSSTAPPGGGAASIR